jgi:hypothetical protein
MEFYFTKKFKIKYFNKRIHYILNFLFLKKIFIFKIFHQSSNKKMDTTQIIFLIVNSTLLLLYHIHFFFVFRVKPYNLNLGINLKAREKW